jgi:hypothetical protein
MVAKRIIIAVWQMWLIFEKEKLLNIFLDKNG